MTSQDRAALRGSGSGSIEEEQTVEEDDTADDQATKELKPDADGDPMREQTETVQDASAPAPDRGGHARAPPSTQGDSSEGTGSSGGSSTPPSSGESDADSGAPAGNEDAFQEAKDITRESAASGDPVGGGVETGEGEASEQAREFEQDVIEKTPGVESEEQVRVTRDGDELRAELTDSGQLGAHREMRRQARERQDTVLTGIGVEGTRETGYRAPRSGEPTKQERDRQNEVRNAFEGLGIEGTAQTGFRGPRTGEVTKQEQEAEARARNALSGLGFEGSGDDRSAPRVAGATTERERRALQSEEVQEAVREAERANFSFDVAGHTIEVGGRTGEYEAVRGEDGEIQIRQVDEFNTQTRRPISIGVGNAQFDTGVTVGDVERGLDSVISGGRAVADTVGDAFVAGSAQASAANPTLMFGRQFGLTDAQSVEPDATARFDVEGETTEAAFRNELDEMSELSESTGSTRFASGAVSEAASVPTYPLSVARAGIEGSELVGSAIESAEEGTASEFASNVGERAAGAAASAATTVTEQPYATAGRAVGSLAGSGLAMAGAAKLGPRAGAAARWGIQPGEEALGAAGYRVTRAAASERRADQLFPNQEPIIFSEEAAIRGGKRIAARARDSNVRERIREFPYGGGESRGQARLTGTQKRRGKSEQQEDDGDLGVPDDDPFRVSDKRLYDPAREFGDADDPSRFIDETRRGAPESQQDIGTGIAGQGNPQTATGELSFEENFNRAIRRQQEAATRPEARVSETELGGRALETNLAGPDTGVSDLGLESEALQVQEPQVRLRERTRTDTGVETDVGFETEFETRQDARQEFRTAQEFESPLEFETETAREFEFELELETETTRETEVEAEPLRENTRRRGGVSDLFGGERRTKTRRLIDPLTGR